MAYDKTEITLLRRAVRKKNDGFEEKTDLHQVSAG